MGGSSREGAHNRDRHTRVGDPPLPRTCLLSEALMLRLPRPMRTKQVFESGVRIPRAGLTARAATCGPS
ncbi:hypothetical protein GCM10023084_38630 [Streptomyces lacrimifluminis]|uniref:Uncharacterized protein n=1 Tax=Streptomyces lacrimifluminis TaxID=1500077 RepID=A0A917L124_9ACTN|nr:hypothetical protein GCM10012282_40250 [Streptomyces lacrimifluminis]